ncbi:uncharacterized protein (TIGR02594 family) [Chryseobacterium defluvii]|uniref:Uncharacterized protein (TIGR02594 family) n=1 Tax=Chryseobacterium defluvii TaxID=160396 RepID=A0A840KAZ4_9FLAO|nr:TIGR02594 family protein [Chryseobacterium defluvii]MBB4804770.1 uncharacterized protein (TIGR02594 family) [Chryseobacterium defluvii]
MALTKQYEWLTKENGPIMIKQALNLYDTSEVLGAKNNPTILSWAKEVGQDPMYKGVKDFYIADSIPWCGLFMAVVAKRSSKQIVKDPLWALNWGNFGKHTPVPMLGDVLVFIRKGGGHVGLYVGEDATCYHVLGGNQSDKVCITRIEKNRLYTSRRPKYINQPVNVRKISLSSSGTVSQNEA